MAGLTYVIDIVIDIDEPTLKCSKFVKDVKKTEDERYHIPCKDEKRSQNEDCFLHSMVSQKVKGWLK